MVAIRRNTTWLAPLLVLSALALAPGAVGAATPTWHTQPIATPVATDTYFLNGISCSASDACTGVGAEHTPGSATTDTSLVERWDGTEWTVQAAPTPAGATDVVLLGVSCPTATTCIAAGDEIFPVRRVYVLAWDGTSWSFMSLPTAVASADAGVGGVDCVATAWCKLAGSVLGPNGETVPFVDTWNGTTWSADAVPLPSAATNGFFSAIDCFAQNSCAAVGNFGSQSLGNAGRAPALAETWNGKTWHVDSAADPGAQTLLSGVSCPASGTCYAVGHYRNGAGHSAPLVEKKGGALWLNQAAPKPKTATDFELLSISCTSSSSCETVGSAFGGGIATYGYAAVFGGIFGWKVETLPVRDLLQALSCPASTFCVGTGADMQSGDPISAIRS
jgi:hypothetical protein